LHLTTNTVTVTVPKSSNAKTVTATVSALANTVTVTHTIPQSDLTTTVTATASGSARTVTVISDVATTVTSDIATTVTTTASVAPSSACPNQFVNPGFESGTTGWTYSQDNPGVSFVVQSSSSIPGGAHSGNYASAFVSNGAVFLPGNPTDIYQSFSNIPATCGTSGTYQISGYIETVANQCYVNIYNDPQSGRPVLSAQISPGDRILLGMALR